MEKQLGTHCKRGHEFTPQNTYYRVWKGRRIRVCRACNNERVARYLERRAKEIEGDLLWDYIASGFWDRIVKDPETACWLWQGHLNDGYAKISVGGKWRRVQLDCAREVLRAHPKRHGDPPYLR